MALTEITEVQTPAQTRVYGVNPATGERLEPGFACTTIEQLDTVCNAASGAATEFAATPGFERGRFLRAIAEQLTLNGVEMVRVANLETGLPLPRLQGELLRTTGQLRLFAEVVEEGSWVDARIDEALPERKPMPRSDIRSMLRPLGPVAVFGASNFPLAFSVAGGDTAAALAAGCPVVVKAHPAHPGTSHLAGEAIAAAARAWAMPEGVFSLVFDSGIEVGRALVEHPAIKAVAFTGSIRAGKALMALANGRPEPIPCYAEMGSTNPLFLLPGALKAGGAALAAGVLGSFTLGSGQFCTKPGLVFVPELGGDEFTAALGEGVGGLQSLGMLTPGIASSYKRAIRERGETGVVEWVGGRPAYAEGPAAVGAPTVFRVALDTYLEHDDLEEEIFGPTTLLIHYGKTADLVAAAQGLHGHLTATIHGTVDDLRQAGDLLRVLETKVGRILFGGYPTGVEVCSAMVHGGPFPATSDARSTSVGTRALLRFARPICYQDFPDDILPAELRRANPLGIERMVNGALGRI